jgi:hypothetical protein
MVASSTAPEFVQGRPDTFTISTTANSDAGKMVKLHIGVPDGVQIEYQVANGGWASLAADGMYGYAFGVSDTTFTFRGTFNEPGNYTLPLDFKMIPDGTVLVGSVVAAHVTPVRLWADCVDVSLLHGRVPERGWHPHRSVRN